MSPDLVIVGGGVSRKADKWLPYITADTEVVPATLTNEAGIVGASLVVVSPASGSPDPAR
jgi:polyphosphate glucokinase